MTLSGCSAATSPDTRTTDESVIRKLDADWVAAAQTKQVDAWVAFYSADAAALPPNDKVAVGRDAIRKPVGDLLGLPGLAIAWHPTKIEVARSGELAYLYGAYELSWNDAGKRMTDVGKIVEIWKKQPDGSWKCIVDTWNSDLPVAPFLTFKITSQPAELSCAVQTPAQQRDTYEVRGQRDRGTAGLERAAAFAWGQGSLVTARLEK